MKLIRCYIENFGGLHQYKLSFSPTLTVIKESNGFGKSTLAAFIRIMFFGMPRSGKLLEKNDRKRYLPWQGGTYGGYLEFEYEGIVYRIERTFGSVPKEDTFQLYTLSPLKKCSRFSENIGEELFQVSAESFEKTTYISQIYRGGSFVTPEIKAKLADVIACTDDMNTFEQAIAALQKKRNYLLSSRGTTGVIASYTEKIANTEIRLHQLENLDAQFSALQEELRAAERELSSRNDALGKIRTQIAAYYEHTKQNELAEQYAALQAQEHQIAMQEAALLENYPLGVPTEKELQELAVPTPHLSALDFSNDEYAKLRTLRNLFPSKVPSIDTIQEAAIIQCEILEEQSALQQTVNSLSKLNKGGRRFLIPSFIFLILLCAIACGVFYKLQQTILWQISGFSAAVLFAITSVTSLHRRLTRKKLENRQFQHKAAIECSAEELQRLLEPYMDDFDSNIALLQEVLSDSNSYTSILKKLESRRNPAHDTLSQLLQRYMLDELPPSQQTINRILNDRKKLDFCHQQWVVAQQACQQFLAQHGEPQYQELPEKMDKLIKTEATLCAAITQLQECISKQAYQIEQLTRSKKAANDLQDELAALLEKRDAALHQVEVIDKTIHYLTSAKNQLAGNFLLPVQDRFADYVSLCMDWPRETVSVSDDFSIYIEVSGVQREVSYFSAGETDWLMLSLRFAIMDVLYTKTSPLLVLDDPFTNLDDDRIKAALALLNKLSNTHQILYLTCSEHRT